MIPNVPYWQNSDLQGDLVDESMLGIDTTRLGIPLMRELGLFSHAPSP